MDNMSAHCTDAVKATASELAVHEIFLPPNTTTLLQPLDSSLNKTFKGAASKCWAKWWAKDGCKNLTPKGNPRKAPLSEIKQWVVTAWDTIDAQSIMNCWSHTLNGETVVEEARQRLAARAAGTAVASAATSAPVSVNVGAAADEVDLLYGDVIVDAEVAS